MTATMAVTVTATTATVMTAYKVITLLRHLCGRKSNIMKKKRIITANLKFLNILHNNTNVLYECELYSHKRI